MPYTPGGDTAPSAFALNNCNAPVDSIPNASQIVAIQEMILFRFVIDPPRFTPLEPHEAASWRFNTELLGVFHVQPLPATELHRLRPTMRHLSTKQQGLG